jgi:hypothetical protein
MAAQKVLRVINAQLVLGIHGINKGHPAGVRKIAQPDAQTIHGMKQAKVLGGFFKHSLLQKNIPRLKPAI